MNLIERVKNMLVTPKTEWEIVNLEADTMQNVITKYVVPLAVVGAICTFIGYGFIWRYGSINIGIRQAVIQLISSIAGVVITSYVVDALAPSFNSQKNIHKSAQLVAYGYTPAFVGSFFNILPAIAIIGSLLGLYGIYLLYLGLGPIKKTPEDKKVVYLLVTIAILIGIYLVLGAILAAILLRSIVY